MTAWTHETCLSKYLSLGHCGRRENMEGEERTESAAGSPLVSSEALVVVPRVLSQTVQWGWVSGLWGPWLRKAPVPARGSCPLPSPSPGDPSGREASARPGMAPMNCNGSYPCQMWSRATSAWYFLGLLQVTGEAG